MRGVNVVVGAKYPNSSSNFSEFLDITANLSAIFKALVTFALSVFLSVQPRGKCFSLALLISTSSQIPLSISLTVADILALKTE